jgi:hypothetical protein
METPPSPPPTEVHRDDTVKNEIVTVINDPRASLVTGSEQGWLSRINGLTLGMTGIAIVFVHIFK